MSRIILVAGPGRCGLISALGLLAKQPGTSASCRTHRSFPGTAPQLTGSTRERFARFRRKWQSEVIADAAGFYLPYLADAIAVEPDIRIVG